MQTVAEVDDDCIVCNSGPPFQGPAPPAAPVDLAGDGVCFFPAAHVYVDVCLDGYCVLQEFTASIYPPKSHDPRAAGVRAFARPPADAPLFLFLPAG